MEKLSSPENRESAIDKLVEGLAEKEGMNPEDIFSDIITFAKICEQDEDAKAYFEEIAEKIGITFEETMQYAIKKIEGQFGENEQYEEWLKDNPEIEIPKENLRACEPEITEFEDMISSFESTYSFEELHSIIDLTAEEAPNYPVREQAKSALIPIVMKLNALEKETDISPEKLGELKAKYKRLSRAVGIINSNKVDHSR